MNNNAIIYSNINFKIRIKTMKRVFLFFSVILAISLVLTGCSNSTGTGANSQTAASSGGRNRRPDFGQPDRPADIRGIVKSITGNEVTILKVDFPNRQASSTPSGLDSTTSKEAFSLGGVTGTGAAGRQGRTGGGGFGGPGGPGGPGGGQGTGNREQMLAKLKAMSTGEEKVIIPVGIKMMKPSSTNTGAGKREMSEATLTDITTDKTLMIWLNTNVGTSPTGTSTSTSDRKIADFVLINN